MNLLNSASQALYYPQPSSSATQGDGAPMHRGPTTLAQKGRTISQGGHGPNTLLKQAIANRIGREDGQDARERSLLSHPAWHRDQDGRTGYTPRGFDTLPNRQKDFVKSREPETSQVEVHDQAKKIEKTSKVTINVRSSSKERLEEDSKDGRQRKPSPRRTITRDTSDSTIRAVPLTRVPDDRLLKTKNLGERRESSVSDSSRVSIQSGKSVKFSDRIQINEIERHERETSSEEDVAVMSDDEMGRERERDKRKNRKDLKDQKDISRESLDFEELERKILEEQKELEAMGKKMPSPLPMYRISQETESIASFYPEDIQPDRFLIGEDEYEYVSLDQLPNSVRQAVIRDLNEGNLYEEMDHFQPRRREREEEGSGIHLGSMSRLHDVPQSPDGSNPLAELPRSASGYLDDQTGLHDSYQQAMQGHAFQPVLRAPEKSNMFQSYYENVQGGYVGQASPGISTKAVLNEMRNDPTSPTSPIRELSLKDQRQAFFRSMLPAEETVSGPTSPTSPEETEMRRQFVQRYGRRKAPIAEVDPADPRPSLGASQDSVISTGSHESVVSAASIRAERAVRRDFNY